MFRERELHGGKECFFFSPPFQLMVVVLGHEQLPLVREIYYLLPGESNFLSSVNI